MRKIRLVNDSRPSELRKQEMVKTLGNLIKASNKIPGIGLSYRDRFLMAVTLNDDSLHLIEDQKKSDTS